jgi:methylmalonyl-CoA mutase cobalamin-binding subunit
MTINQNGGFNVVVNATENYNGSSPVPEQSGSYNPDVLCEHLRTYLRNQGLDPYMVGGLMALYALENMEQMRPTHPFDQMQLHDHLTKVREVANTLLNRANKVKNQ